eukprot:2293155-Lingulodinium_polyedra.AAC.1
MPLPRACLDKDICSKFFLNIITEVGNRVSAWAKRAIQQDASIVWKKGMAYDMIFKDSEMPDRVTG